MTEVYRQVNGRRVFCGRCRHQENQDRLEGGQYDAPGMLTFWCHDCHCIYAVCAECAVLIPHPETAQTCPNNHPVGK